MIIVMNYMSLPIKTISFSVQLESGGEQDLDALDQTQSDYLSAASDLEDTDGEGFTDGEAYTDEDLDEAYPGQDAAALSRNSRRAGAALARSSEPASGHHSPVVDPEPRAESYALREIPPLMHVPEPRMPRRDSHPNSAAEEDVPPTQRSNSDSEFSASEPFTPTTISDGPPDFKAPDPSTQQSVADSSLAERPPESPPHAPLSVIEEKLQQVNEIVLSCKER